MPGNQRLSTTQVNQVCHISNCEHHSPCSFWWMQRWFMFKTAKSLTPSFLTIFGWVTKNPKKPKLVLSHKTELKPLKFLEPPPVFFNSKWQMSGSLLSHVLKSSSELPEITFTPSVCLSNWQSQRGSNWLRLCCFNIFEATFANFSCCVVLLLFLISSYFAEIFRI